MQPHRVTRRSLPTLARVQAYDAVSYPLFSKHLRHRFFRSESLSFTFTDELIRYFDGDFVSMRLLAIPTKFLHKKFQLHFPEILMLWHGLEKFFYDTWVHFDNIFFSNEILNYLASQRSQCPDAFKYSQVHTKSSVRKYRMSAKEPQPTLFLIH